MLLLALAAPAAAQEVDCTVAESQNELTYCAEQDWNRADADLNAVYKTVIAQLRDLDADLPDDLKGGEDALRRAQRAWVAFRDAECEAEGYAMRGGSGEAMLIYSCRARLSDQRAPDLAMILPEN